MKLTILFSHIFFALDEKKNIHTDPPEVTLTLGSTLNPDDIKENDDVYFECNVKANPSTVRISWSHDVSILFYLNSIDLDLLSIYEIKN